MEDTNKGYIYLLQLCDEKKELVYKIGKSDKIDKRLKTYNLKKILFYIFINDYENIEKYLISIIKNKYKIASGREFFYCNDNEEEIITFFMNNIINNYNKPERIIIDHQIYIYKKDIDEKISKEYDNKIELFQKINNDKYNSMIDEMNNKIQYLEKLNNDKYNLIVDLNEKYNKLYIENNNLNIDKNELNEKYNLLSSLNIELNKITEKNNLLSSLNIELNNKNNELSSLYKDLNNKFNSLNKELNKITEKNNLLSSLNIELNNKNSQLSLLNKDLNKKNIELYSLNKNLNKKNSELSSLNNEEEQENILIKDVENKLNNEENDTEKDNIVIYKCKKCNYSSNLFTDIKRHFNRNVSCKNIDNEYCKYTNDQKIILSLLPDNTENNYIDKLKPDYKNIYKNNIKELIDKLSFKDGNKKCCSYCNASFDRIQQLREHIIIDCFYNEIINRI
jgi:hypothetical protein